ncbi:hypothetical protein HK100_004913 [Physocladia obscura]|uniref:Glycosyltransferase n=1 Tax=Physocladia obscura TaxID=109957 RepID=A0AAD5SXW2_9FUNG|nr:hypothetical protein HK100_004913 [Physocladia obscura]
MRMRRRRLGALALCVVTALVVALLLICFRNRKQTQELMLATASAPLRKVNATGSFSYSRVGAITVIRPLPNKTNVTGYVSTGEFTLAQLVHLCHSGFGEYKSLEITRTHAIATHDLRHQTGSYLSKCHSIEISASQDGRSMGHCADFSHYLRHTADARLSRQFGHGTYVRKAALCHALTTTFLHFEFAIEPLLRLGDVFNISNAWVPNIEQIGHSNLWYFDRMDAILCKTRVTCRAISAYLNDTHLTSSTVSSEANIGHGNKNIGPSANEARKIHQSDVNLIDTRKVSLFEARKVYTPRLIYMGHSSPDARLEVFQSLVSSSLSSSTSQQQEPTRNFNAFFHAYGSSGRKSTVQLVDCWSQHRWWPPLTIVGTLNRTYFESRFGSLASNIIIISDLLNTPALRRLQYANAVHVCPSQQEGYGHYINEARAMGAMIVTTNHPPMNEFVVDGYSGVLIEPSAVLKVEPYQGLGDYFVSPVDITPGDVCTAVKRVLGMGVGERREFGRRARMQYDLDTRLFVERVKVFELEEEEIARREERTKDGLSV